jgi:hypothetical protein
MKEATMDRDEIAREERATTEETRAEAGAPQGFAPPVPDYAGGTGVTDLGVAEPVVPDRLRGKRVEPPPNEAPEG